MAHRIIKTTSNIAAQKTIEHAQLRWQGELAYEVGPFSSAIYEVSFTKDIAQAPLVFYSIQSNSESSSITNSYLIKRDAACFQVLLENNREEPAAGTLLYLAFVRQP